ncbi:GNAT family N-acetyltransferase [Acetobacter estunensis]|uniref:GNAT family N-acetyltransferase n=1 Tax=Acetobacter estunensis TaxID=104097 RepID=UPI001C2D93F7|nr:GNAT family N-acetyltransferase [Acetobacter estunensis]MBV1837387.1 GNAT family N-acetyltransferase [Acetobacter estunensis]
MQIRPAHANDQPALWAILGPIIRAGDTYALDRDMEQDEALAYWLGSDKETFVAHDDSGALLGTYYLRPNQAGGGRHVCNCGYMTHVSARGRGIGQQMALHSLAHAHMRGYRAMQFNFVISTNENAIRLWQQFGFHTVGRLPDAFDHPLHGPVDALVMYRALNGTLPVH